MSIHDEDLAEAVSGNLITSGIQQVPHHAGWERKSTWLLFSFVNLAIEEIWKDHCILFLGGPRRPLAYLNQIRTQWDMRAMLFQNSDRQDTGIGCLPLSIRPITGCKLV